MRERVRERELSESGRSGMLLEVQRGGVSQREGRGHRRAGRMRRIRGVESGRESKGLKVLASLKTKMTGVNEMNEVNY